ncbi:radical SAM protein [bacterium]|nr:radical SAM protein [candidate division CSSED10-310 bacterium]
MRILLLNPTIRSGEPIVRAERCQSKLISGIWPPIVLAYLAAILRRADRRISILDAVIEGMPFEAMIRWIIRDKPDWLIVQNTTPTLPDDLVMARLVKDHLPDIHISFFGLHATARPGDVLQGGVVDTAMLGEPETTAADLAAALDGAVSPTLVPGLACMDGNNVHRTPRRPPIQDLDALPWPDRDLLANDRYLIPTTRRPFTLVKTSRGCPHQCSFCTAATFFGSRWRSRNPREVYDEMCLVHDRYGIRDIVLHADTFNHDRDTCMELLDLIRTGSRQFRWMSNTRVDTLDETMVRAMKDSGCWLVTMGVESGDDAILLHNGKRATSLQARTAIALLKRHGIRVIAYFLLGLPGETRETAEKTMRFALETEPDYAHFYVVTPFPGTVLFSRAAAAGWLTSRDWRRYYHGVSDVLSYPHLSARDLTGLSRRYYRKFYFRPSRILNEIHGIDDPRQMRGYLSTLKHMVRVWLIR